MNRLLLFLTLLSLLAIGAAAAKRRRLIHSFEGTTPSEARERIVGHVMHRTDDPAKADHIADHLVARLEARGVLAPEPA